MSSFATNFAAEHDTSYPIQDPWPISSVAASKCSMTTYHQRWQHSASAGPGSWGTPSGYLGKRAVHTGDTHRLHLTMQHTKTSRMLYMYSVKIGTTNISTTSQWLRTTKLNARGASSEGKVQISVVGPAKAGYICLQRYQGEIRYFESAIPFDVHRESADSLSVMKQSPHPKLKTKFLTS